MYYKTLDVPSQEPDYCSVVFPLFTRINIFISYGEFIII